MRRAVALLLPSLVVLGSLSGCSSPSQGRGGDALTPAGTQASASVYPGTYQFDGQYSRVVVKGPYDALPPQKVFIKSKLDGVDIEIGFHLPKVPTGTKVPVIIQASPYYRVSQDVNTLQGLLLFLHDNFLPYGYAIAGVAVRGTGNSGGCMDFGGKKEVADLDQAITWLAEQPWSNGKVAMIGKSYDGSTPWEVASTGNKYLKTIVPISGWAGHFEGGNGSAVMPGSLLMPTGYYSMGSSLDDIPAGGQATQYQRTPIHRVEGAACPDYAAGLASTASCTFIAQDPLGYCAERNLKPTIAKNYRGSVLLVGGMQDESVSPGAVIPWVNGLNESGVPLKIMLGQWSHSAPDRSWYYKIPQAQRWDWAEILVHWFDKYLKEMPNVDTGPTVQVQDNTYRWRNEEHYPPRDASWTTLHLATDQTLAKQPGAAGSVLLAPNPTGDQLGPTFQSLPGHSAEFRTPTLEKDIIVSGLPRLHITVTPHGPTGYLAASLYDVDESGSEKRVGSTLMNLWYADGTGIPRVITPGTPLLARMEFGPLDASFRTGHRILVRVSESYESGNLSATPPEAPTDFPAILPEPVTLNFGGSSKSILEALILERGPEAYFQPPMPHE